MIANAEIETTGTTILTVPAGKSYAVVNMIFCNYSVSAVTFDLHVIPNGQSQANRSLILSDRELDTKDSLFMSTEKLLLGAGDVLRAVSSADSAMVACVSYTEI